MRPVKEIKWENCYKTYCQDEFGVFHKDLSGAKKKMKRLSILVESSAHKSSTHGCCDEFYEMITICAYDYGNIMSSHYCTVVDLWHIKSFPITLYKMYIVSWVADFIMNLITDWSDRGQLWYGSYQDVSPEIFQSFQYKMIFASKLSTTKTFSVYQCET